MRLSEEIRLSVTKHKTRLDKPAAPWPSVIRAWAKAAKELEKERDLFSRTVGLLLDQIEREKLEKCASKQVEEDGSPPSLEITP